MLSGYRILDLTHEGYLICGKILGDLGADVIKIEKPDGDPARRIGPFYKGESLFWLSYNANKRSITLDIETSDGKAIFKELVKRADVVVESTPVGYCEKLGLGYSVLAKVNPSIIVTSITPFGEDGPYRDYKGSDMVCAAMSGWMYLCGDPDRPPVVVSFPQSYLCAGGDAAIGTMLALYERTKSGMGQHVVVSTQQSVIINTNEAVPYWVLSKTMKTRSGAKRVGFFKAGISQRNVWPCKDGYVFWYLVGGLMGAKGNQALVDWLDSEGMASEFLKGIDWSNLDMQEITQEVIDKIQGEAGEFFKNHTKHELYEGAVHKGIMLYPVSEVRDLLENKQLESRGFWTETEYPELNAFIMHPGAFAKSTEYAISTRHRAPLVGEHNEEIYTGELHLSKEDLEVLERNSII